MRSQTAARYITQGTEDRARKYPGFCFSHTLIPTQCHSLLTPAGSWEPWKCSLQGSTHLPHGAGEKDANLKRSE